MAGIVHIEASGSERLANIGDKNPDFTLQERTSACGHIAASCLHMIPAPIQWRCPIDVGVRYVEEHPLTFFPWAS